MLILVFACLFSIHESSLAALTSLSALPNAFLLLYRCLLNVWYSALVTLRESSTTADLTLYALYAL